MSALKPLVWRTSRCSWSKWDVVFKKGFLPAPPASPGPSAAQDQLSPVRLRRELPPDGKASLCGGQRSRCGGGYLATLRTLPNIYKPSPGETQVRYSLCTSRGLQTPENICSWQTKNEMILIAGLSVSLRMNIAGLTTCWERAGTGVGSSCNTDKCSLPETVFPLVIV